MAWKTLVLHYLGPMESMYIDAYIHACMHAYIHTDIH